MRATRAYIAGFGTAGSLVAGAAIVFVLASAVVAFRGWPQVGNSGQGSSIVFGRQAQSRAPSNVDRQLVAAVAAAPVTSGVGASGTAGGGHAGTGHSGGASTRVTAGGNAVGDGAAQSTTVATPSQPTSPSGGCGSCGSKPTGGGNPVSGVVQTTTSGLGSTVEGATSSLGSTVSGVAKVIATKLGLGNTGAAAGSALNGAGSVLSSAGKTVGGLLGAQ
jgi:hypothetical protein